MRFRVVYVLPLQPGQRELRLLDKDHASVRIAHATGARFEQKATKRRAENIEHKLYAEAMSHAQDDNGRKNFYEQKLQEIYKKMHLLVKSHQDKGPGALPGGVAAGPFVSLASNGLNPQGSFTGPLPAQGSAGQRPLAALPATTAVATQPQGDSKQPLNAPGDAAAVPAGAWVRDGLCSCGQRRTASCVRGTRRRWAERIYSP